MVAGMTPLTLTFWLAMAAIGAAAWMCAGAMGGRR
jgi:hypothetical protein